MPDSYGAPALVVSCEHGGNQVPHEFAELFRGREKLLESHRGYDIGILPFAERLAGVFAAPFEASSVTRLLVDLNRSPGSRACFSEISRPLAPTERAAILRDYYEPYRRRVTERVAERLAVGSSVLHLSVHSFTPQFDGRTRKTEVGLLYDPAHAGETDFCRRWREVLGRLDPALRVHRNAPYRGTSDSLVKTLRQRFGSDRYLGIELEINQKFPVGPPQLWQDIQSLLEQSLRAFLG
ncbi:MAG TPA: N-formylglutamate amidohydrolase [Desulfuromonadales bacterium]|nr:N-formylglutamate amidohydrolase [Desulfuromonadales bacterium]